MENEKYVKRTQAQKLSWLINLFAEIFRITSVNSQQNILKKLEKDGKENAFISTHGMSWKYVEILSHVGKYFLGGACTLEN